MRGSQRQWVGLAGLPDAGIDLPRGALPICAPPSPDLDPGLHLRRLEGPSFAALASILVKLESASVRLH